MLFVIQACLGLYKISFNYWFIYWFLDILTFNWLSTLSVEFIYKNQVLMYVRSIYLSIYISNINLFIYLSIYRNVFNLVFGPVIMSLLTGIYLSI
jgi:hypothetical protein